MQAGHAVVGGRLAVRGQQVPHQIVVHAEAAQQRVARGDLQHLGGAQRVQQGGGFFRDAEAEQGLLAVRADQALSQHQVGQIGFADLGEDLVGVHRSAPAGCLGVFVAAFQRDTNCRDPDKKPTSGRFHQQVRERADALVRQIPTRCRISAISAVLFDGLMTPPQGPGLVRATGGIEHQRQVVRRQMTAASRDSARLAGLLADLQAATPGVLDHRNQDLGLLRRLGRPVEQQVAQREEEIRRLRTNVQLRLREDHAIRMALQRLEPEQPRATRSNHQGGRFDSSFDAPSTGAVNAVKHSTAFAKASSASAKRS
ncbi:hypothetical protein Ddc_20535 [Ditylenchus destructor]|nr:hypothetical protein Ddc_20535 [Ditylenchus destructor]